MLGFDALGKLALGQGRRKQASTAVLVADAGSYGIAGSAISFGGRLSALAGSYAITGTSIAFGGSLLAAKGSYAIAGGGATFETALLAVAGSYGIIGNPTVFRTAFAVDSGAYLLTGNDVGLPAFFQCLSGSYEIVGADAAFPMQWVVEPGSYVITLGEYELRRTGDEYDQVYGGIGHYLEEQLRLKQLAAITRKVPPPIMRPVRPNLRPLGQPQMRMPVLSAVPQTAVDGQAIADQRRQAALAKRRRQVAEILLLAS